MADDNGSSGLLWFLAGLGIGAAVGVLYAPKSGRETREAILNYAEEGRELVRDRAREYREQAQDLYERSRETFSQQKDQIRSAVEAGRQAYREATQEVGVEGGATKA
ncbi:MAG TPA: YtxH domain-containing protein [Clostridia bacterium]|nr:YtxH domain-containing protein [Clostridia bacterium]